jgi:hypothetical protein
LVFFVTIGLTVCQRGAKGLVISEWNKIVVLGEVVGKNGENDQNAS